MNTIKISTLALLVLLLVSCKNTTSPPHATHNNPQAAEYNIKLGLAYMQQGETARAKRKLLTAITQAPHSAEANGAMAYFLEASGEIKSAKTYYLKAIKYSAEKGAAYNNYGAYLCRRKAFIQAERYLLAAAKEPSYVNSADAYENAGLCATQIPDFAKAKKYFTLAIARAPERATSMIELAEIAYKERNLVLARNYMKQFQRLAQPSAKSAWLNYRIARQSKRRQARQYAAILKKQFRDSREYRLYKSGVL